MGICAARKQPEKRGRDSKKTYAKDKLVIACFIYVSLIDPDCSDLFYRK